MTGKRTSIWIAALIVLLALAPWVAGSFTVSLLNDIGIGALVALGLVLLTGVGGTTSFGQAAFVGIAAYASAWLTTAHGLSPWLGLLFALVLTGISAVLIGMLTLRLGEQRLLARITRYSCDQLGLQPGQMLWAQIKAVALLG